MRKVVLSSWFRLTLVMLAVCLLAQPAWTQKKKKDAAKEEAAPVVPVEAVSDNEQIDRALSEMLAGWQIGESSMMQKHYSPDAVFVSGAYEPPIVGWTNYLQVYQTQRLRMTNIAMNRSNTLIRVKGTGAVSNYQWQFSATVDGSSMWVRGHSSIVWEKKDGKWLALHNHTSLVDQGAPQPAKPAAPAKQP